METTSDQPPVRIGLTGGIASGKSTVARMFEALGAPLIDTDVIAREVVAPGEPGLTEVREAFGDDVLTDSGELNRVALRERIFNDSDARRRLEKILHPLIRARVIAALKEASAPYVIIAVPLLVETGFNELVDRVLVVDCEPQTQIQRLMDRDGESRKSATVIVNAQAARADRLAIADDLVTNDGDVEATQAQVQSLHHRYLELATVCRARSGHAE